MTRGTYTYTALAAALAETDEYLADSTGVLVPKDSPILTAARERLAQLEPEDETWHKCGPGTWRLAKEET